MFTKEKGLRMTMKNKYEDMNEIAAFGFLTNALFDGGGDRGATFPRSDAEDFSRGLRFIPGEVTIARRAGEQVVFMQPCNHPCCWYWQFPDGSRTYYWERGDYELIAVRNGNKPDAKGNVIAGPCPDCGNPHTSGGYIKAAELAE